MNKLPKIGLFETVLLLFDYRTRYRIEGDSMLPILKHGEQVLINEKADLKNGDIVVAQHPFKTDIEIVKRIREIDEGGKYFLIGDNLSESTDSRNFGTVSRVLIRGKVVCRLQ